MISNHSQQKVHDIDLCKELKTSIGSLNSVLYSTAVIINQIKQMTNSMQAKIKLAQENLFGCEADLENYIEISSHLEGVDGK